MLILSLDTSTTFYIQNNKTREVIVFQLSESETTDVRLRLAFFDDDQKYLIVRDPKFLKRPHNLKPQTCYNRDCKKVYCHRPRSKFCSTHCEEHFHQSREKED